MIKLSTIVLLNIDNGLFDDVELVELCYEIIEVKILYGNNYGVLLIIPMEIRENIQKERLRTYIF